MKETTLGHLLICNNKTKFGNFFCTFKSGVNFIKVLPTAFTLVDPKSVKKIQLSHQYLFTLSGCARVKAVCRTLMKLSPGPIAITLVIEWDCYTQNSFLDVFFHLQNVCFLSKLLSKKCVLVQAIDLRARLKLLLMHDRFNENTMKLFFAVKLKQI